MKQSNLYNSVWLRLVLLLILTLPAFAGFLTYVEVHKDDVDGLDGPHWVWSLTLSPDGKHVYAAGYGHCKVIEFSRDASTGKLTFIEV